MLGRNILGIQSRSGFSIVEVLMTSAIVIVIAMAFASLTNNLYREFKGMTEKADAAEVRNSMILAFANSNICSWQLMGKTINTAGVTATTASSTDITIPTLYAGLNTSSYVIARANTKVSVNQSSLTVDTIHLKNIFGTGYPDEYVGTIHVTFKADSLVRPLKGATTQVVFVVDPAGPASARSIVGCTSAGAKPFQLDTSYLKKFHTGIDIDCLNMNTQKMFWDSACYRFCGVGCKVGGTDQNCTVNIPGQGFPGGVATECAGVLFKADCLCLR